MTTIIPRSAWTTIPNTAPRVDEPYNEVVVHTEAGAVLPQDWPAITAAAAVLSLTERQHMAAIDAYHRNVRGWENGFGYNFLIERDGTIIEGRGWGRVGGHTQHGRNYTAMAICFAGHGDLQAATAAQWAAARDLIAESIRQGELTADYVVTGHRNYAPKSCPGNLIFPHIGRLRGVTADLNPSEEDNIMALVTEERFEALEEKVARQGRQLDDIHGEVMVTVKGKTRLDRMAAWGDTLSTIKDVVVKIARHLKVPSV